MSQQSYSQEKPKQPSWWIGLAGGANFNSYEGTTTKLNVDFNDVSPAFHKGHGVGGYLGALIEYHREGSIWGLRLLQGADSRRAIFKAGGNRLTAKIGYFSIEPALLIMPMKSHFYFYAGPQLRLLWSTGFTFKAPNTPEYPQKNINYPAYIKNLEKVKVSLHVGAGYDFMVLKKTDKRNFIVSPFVTYFPSFNQNLRTIEDLQLNTIRAGIIFKVGLNSEN